MSSEAAGREADGGNRETQLEGEARVVREARGPDGAWRLEEWQERWPDVAAGITGSSEDYGLTGEVNAWTATSRYQALGRRLGFPTVAVARQVHGRRVRSVNGPADDGVRVTGEYDGQVTGSAGILLAVTAADCVPVYLLSPEREVWALIHAGWRGTAAGVLESALERLNRGYGVPTDELHLHLGPSICGECYEVGPEVVEALRPAAALEGGDGNDGSHRVDLRRTLARRARTSGVSGARMTRSAWCTCCSGDQFHSYRCKGQTTGRMAAFLGWREATARLGPRPI